MGIYQNQVKSSLRLFRPPLTQMQRGLPIISTYYFFYPFNGTRLSQRLYTT